jgi:hypothetical protein
MTSVPERLFAVLYGLGAVVIFFANWVGAIRMKASSTRSTLHK